MNLRGRVGDLWKGHRKERSLTFEGAETDDPELGTATFLSDYFEEFLDSIGTDLSKSHITERADGIFKMVNEASRERGLFLRVLNSERFAAFAIPGKQIVLTRGIVERHSDASIAWVIGHEIAHHEFNHVAKFSRYFSKLESFPKLLRTAGTFGLIQLEREIYNCDIEKAADRRGLELAFRAGFDPTEVLEIFEEMAETEARIIATNGRSSRFYPQVAERRSLLEGEAYLLKISGS